VNELLEWLTAIGTFGAFVTAALIFWRSSANASRDRRQTQAVLFDVWLGKVSKYAGTHVVTFDVSNHSDQAIRDLLVVVGIGDANWRTGLAVVQPTERGRYLELPSPHINNTPETAGMNEVQLYALYAPNMEIRFTDTAGRRWKRANDGRLVEVELL
jgi:hypothetical protein